MASPPPPPPPSASAKKTQPLPWTHQETVNLIQAYQEKWYSLKRGQLKSSQWEEVAVTVAARCGYDCSQPSKTAIQCRHKMEKLRQRYRAENQRLAALGPATASAWQYFDSMDLLERGPLPISARPIVALPYHNRHGRDQEEQEHDDDDDDGVIFSKLRSINYILKRPTVVNRFSGGNIEGSGSATKRRREAVDEECEVKVEVAEEEGEKGRDLVLKLAREMRAFGERFVGMENMKMEILRETERCRMEMESKKMEMILKSHNEIVDSIARAFESPNQFNLAHQEI